MRIEIWGPLRLVASGRVVGPRDFSGVKPKQLLEILVAERGHTVTKSRLAELLWTEALPQNYLATLETYVSVLRQTLEPGVRARDSVIMTERGGYRLDTERTTFDVDDFDLLVRSADGLQPVAALQALNAALALIRGQILEDEPYAAWAGQLRSTYTQKQVQVLVDAGRLSLITGEAGAALALAEQAVAIEPLAEAAYQVVMTASYALWRQEDALRAFDRCRKLLANELGVDPMDETVALHLAILRHEDVAALMPRPVEPAIPADAAPVAAAAGDLLGRAAELTRIEEGLALALSGRFTLILVVGDLGIGKTRLVDAVVGRVTRRGELPVGSNRCSDLEAELPYVALSLALRTVIGGHDNGSMPVVSELLRRADLALPFDQFARMRVMESLATTVEAHSPFLLVLDDAHWADSETIATLGYLRRRCPGAPVAVLLTCDRGSLGEALRKLVVDVRIDLDELSAADVAPLGETAYALTDGHPLFVNDWLEATRQGLADGFTPDLRERVVTRCWDLGPQAYRLLTVASVLAEPFSPAELGDLVGASDDDVGELDLLGEQLDRLVDERLLVTVGGRMRFRHALVRRILSETFSATRRARLLDLADGTPRRRSTDVAQQRRQQEDGYEAADPPGRASAGGPSER